MPDRSLRLPPLLLRERHPSPVPPRESDGAPSGGGESAGDGRRPQQAPADENPFAPPPEGAPDRPWQPRHPGRDQDGSGESGAGAGGRSPWGGQWSDRQPGPTTDGRFGERPEGPAGRGSPGAGQGWDPTDPAQRRARYALLGGMWAFFFALFSWPYVALLLGALALYWGVSALRAKPRRPAPDTPDTPASPARPQTSAAISGLVTACLALALVATTFAAQLAYQDYYACVNDALTNVSKQSCGDLLPKELRGVLGTNG